MAESTIPTALIGTITKELQQMSIEANKASKFIKEFTQHLSKSGIDEFEKKLKNAIKSTGKFDEALKHTKNINDVIKIFEKLEDSVSDVIDVNTKQIKTQKSVLSENVEYLNLHKALNDTKSKQLKAEKAGNTEASARYREVREETLKSIRVIRDETNNRINSAKSIQDLTKQFDSSTLSMTKSEKVVNKWNSVIDDSRTQMAKHIAEGAGVVAGFKMVKDGVKALYAELISASNVGLAAAYMQVRSASLDLVLPFEEMQKIITANRNNINALGSGAQGIERFSAVLKDSSKDLVGMLGPSGASRAVAEFTTTLTHSGMGIDNIAFPKTLKNMNDGFKTMNAINGSTVEQYSAHIKTLISTDYIQRKSVGLGREAIAQQIEDIRLRSEQLSMMGLSNKQIEEFNSSLEALIDPNKTTVGSRQNDVVNSNNAMSQMIRTFETNGMYSEAENLRKLITEKNTAGIDKKIINGDVKAGQDFLARNDISELTSKYSNDVQKLQNMRVLNGNAFGNEYTINSSKGAGLNNIMLKTGGQVDLAKKNGMQVSQSQIDKNKMELQESNSTVSMIRDLADTMNRYLQDPLWKMSLGTLLIAGSSLLLASGMLRTAALSLIGSGANGIAGLLGATGIRGIAATALGAITTGVGLPIIGIAATAAAAYGVSKMISSINDKKIDNLKNDTFGKDQLTNNKQVEELKNSIKKEQLTDLQIKIKNQKIIDLETDNKRLDKEKQEAIDIKNKLDEKIADEAFKKSKIEYNSKSLSYELERRRAMQSGRVETIDGKQVYRDKSGNTITQPVEPKREQFGSISSKLQNAIGSGEGNYNSVNRGLIKNSDGSWNNLGSTEKDLSKYSINQILANNKLAPGDPNRMNAVGKYQFIASTLKEFVGKNGITGEEKFTPELQNKLLEQYISKIPGITEYINGKGDYKKAQLSASGVWSSIANPNTGMSSHHGIGNNKSNIASTTAFMSALTEMRNEKMALNNQNQTSISSDNTISSINPDGRVKQMDELINLQKEGNNLVKNSKSITASISGLAARPSVQKL